MEKIGERIEKLMKKYGYTQKEVAKDIGIAEASLSRYISGEREPKAEVLANLATALHTSIDYLVSGVEKETSEIFEVLTRNVDSLTEEEKRKVINIILDHMGGR